MKHFGPFHGIYTSNIYIYCNIIIDTIQLKQLIYDDIELQEPVYYMSILVGFFNAKRTGILKTIWHRIKLACLMLMGKEYRLSEIVLKKQDLDKLKQKLEEF